MNIVLESTPETRKVDVLHARLLYCRNLIDEITIVAKAQTLRLDPPARVQKIANLISEFRSANTEEAEYLDRYIEFGLSGDPQRIVGAKFHEGDGVVQQVELTVNEGAANYIIHLQFPDAARPERQQIPISLFDFWVEKLLDL